MYQNKKITGCLKKEIPKTFVQPDTTLGVYVGMMLPCDNSGPKTEKSCGLDDWQRTLPTVKNL